MKLKPSTKERLTVLAGGGMLLVLILSGWLPRDCPLLGRTIGTCRQTAQLREQTSEERELARVPHQEASTPFLTFTTQAQDYREEAVVNFLYRTSPSSEVATLKFKLNDGSYRSAALITHPLLATMSWPQASNDSTVLYQREAAYATMAELKASLPPRETLAVDAVAARGLELNPSQYVPLEPLRSLEGVNYVLTSRPRPVTDGTWVQFSKRINLSDAQVNGQNNLDWMIERNGDTFETPFRIGTVHLDYRKLRPD